MKKLKIGVFGAGRGLDIAKGFLFLDCDVVALCDFHKERLLNGARRLGKGTALYECFDDFIEHDMDAVILANYFHEHAPFAIRLLERGIHVFCECISNGTMAEGVELIRAAKKSRAIYMLAENYPGMCVNQEMHRICQGGTLGKILFAEGEYNHPSDPYDTAFKKTYNYYAGHWRNFLPRTYYITHSLGPVMYATGATPVRVSAFAAYAPAEDDVPSASYSGDRAAIIMTHNDDGSIFRVTGCAAFGAHDNTYRICGTRGQVENVRGMQEKIMLRYNDWEIPEGAQQTALYTPSWPTRIDPEIARQSGHAGGDYVTARMFVECIAQQKQPPHPFDVYSAVTMSSVAILAHRSVLDGGKPYDIPDFHREECLVRYENDRLSPFPQEDGTREIPCCSHPDYAPSARQMQGYLDLIK